MNQYIERLNPEQREAATTIDGPLLIIAGAGSGKTGVITSRIAYMITQGISPESILAMTFTNKAAGEMAERVKHILADVAPDEARNATRQLTISTFHAFGLSVLRRYGRLIGYRPNFTVYDTSDQIALLKEAARELGINPEDLDVMQALQMFSGIKTERITWNDPRWWDMAAALGPVRPVAPVRPAAPAASRASGPATAASTTTTATTTPSTPGAPATPSTPAPGLSTFQALYQSYREHLLAFNAVDFDDLIAQPLTLFREHPSARAHYADRFRYVMVDEFQDTSTLQYRLLYQLTREWKNVCVVGDDDQSIYSWRGADYSNLRSFEEDFPAVKEIKLERNYRSTGQILSAANAVIANNTHRKTKELWTQLNAGSLIEIAFPDSDVEEAAFIGQKIKILAYQESRSYDSFGILIRTNSQGRLIEEALLEADIPYRMSGGQSFFQRKEIKDIVGYLRVVLNPDDNVSLLRTINTPRRGIGRRAVERLHDVADAHDCSLYSAASLVIHGEIPEDQHKLTGAAQAGLRDYIELIETYQERVESTQHIAAMVQRLIDQVDYWAYLVQEFQKSERAAKAKWKNLSFFVRSIDRYETNPDIMEPSLQGYLNRISLQVKDDLSDEDELGKVHLMTIHASKGLEYDIVFLAGVEAGIIPHQRSVEENDGNVEEERRLFYVSITRARERLYMTSCRKRQVQNEIITSSPSPFLEEIPAELLNKTTADPEHGMEVPEDPFAALKSRFDERS